MRLYPKNYEGEAPREFGLDAHILKTRTFNLGVARDLEEIAIGGSCIWAIAASSLGAQLDIRINDQLRDPLPFQQGMYLRGIPFSRLYVSNAVQAGESITIFFAVEADISNIEIVNPAISFNNVNLTKATVLHNEADIAVNPGATVSMAALDLNRRVVMIHNVVTNAATFRVGTVAADATHGIPLAPGETITLETTAQVFAFNPGGVAQSAAVMWTED